MAPAQAGQAGALWACARSLHVHCDAIKLQSSVQSNSKKLLFAEPIAMSTNPAESSAIRPVSVDFPSPAPSAGQVSQMNTMFCCGSWAPLSHSHLCTEPQQTQTNILRQVPLREQIAALLCDDCMLSSNRNAPGAKA